MKHMLYTLCLVCTGNVLTQESESHSLHNYFWFNYQLAAGNIDIANRWFTKNLQTAPVHVYKGYTQLLHTTGKYHTITTLIPKLDAHFATDPDIQLIFYQALANTGDTEGAHKRLLTLSSQFKSNQEIAYTVAQTYLANREPHNALITINDYLKSSAPKSSNFAFYFLKAQILSQLDKKTEALDSVKKSVRMQPLFDAGWLLRAVLEEQTEQSAAAIADYIKYLELAQGNDMVEKHLLSLFFKQKVAQYGQKQLLLPTNCLEKTVSLFQQKKYAQGLQELDTCLAQQSRRTIKSGKTIVTKTARK